MLIIINSLFVPFWLYISPRKVERDCFSCGNGQVWEKLLSKVVKQTSKLLFKIAEYNFGFKSACVVTMTINHLEAEVLENQE